MLDLDKFTPKQRITKFDAEHGLSEYDGQWIYYIDGARRSAPPHYGRWG